MAKLNVNKDKMLNFFMDHQSIMLNDSDDAEKKTKKNSNKLDSSNKSQYSDDSPTMLEEEEGQITSL